jgi:protein-S-isoprenylcysteine O-methyltransferase Ste14
MQRHGPKDYLMASNFEFRYRVWVIGAIFWAGFSLYTIDHKNSGHALAQSLAHLRGGTGSMPEHRAVFAAAAVMTVVAAALRTWGTAYLKPEVMLSPHLVASRLVADGPYRYVRNPLYLGNILLAIGMGLMASRLGFAVIVLGNAAFVFRLILREEVELEASQGEAYRAYCRAVPRLIPALSPRVASAGGVPDYGAGLMGELFCWAFAVSVVVFAATLNQRLFYWVLAPAFVFYGFAAIAVRRRAKR